MEKRSNLDRSCSSFNDRTVVDENQENNIGFVNFQEKFMEIIDNEDVEDALDLNEKFLSYHLNIDSEDLSFLSKIELRVDTSQHNLQIAGEIL